MGTEVGGAVEEEGRVGTEGDGAGSTRLTR